ncbi:otospiralin-like [Denticeps clupeoides]|uniref:otospiralin-like n=1 Tax=Denticeps clupeoides TaxID=299321 RepID=UPI0010A35441|nr:otospiralin-like [Denticeps clupeoides]
MPRLAPLSLGLVLLGVLCLTGAERTGSEDTGVRDKRSMPNWAMSSSDFFGWMEELRRTAGYDKMEELARTFWAHFPSASRLGYDPPAPEE